MIDWRGEAMLILEGDACHMEEWRKSARKLSIRDIRCMHQLPMDRRHGSKVDVARLRHILEQALLQKI